MDRRKFIERSAEVAAVIMALPIKGWTQPGSIQEISKYDGRKLFFETLVLEVQETWFVLLLEFRFGMNAPRIKAKGGFLERKLDQPTIKGLNFIRECQRALKVDDHLVFSLIELDDSITEIPDQFYRPVAAYYCHLVRLGGTGHFLDTTSGYVPERLKQATEKCHAVILIQ